MFDAKQKSGFEKFYIDKIPLALVIRSNNCIPTFPHEWPGNPAV